MKRQKKDFCSRIKKNVCIQLYWMKVGIIYLLTAFFSLNLLTAAEDIQKTDKDLKEPALDGKLEKITTELENFFRASGSAVSIGGNNAQFMEKHRISDGFSGGIEDFYFEKALSKETTLWLEGHGLFDIHDYYLNLKMEQKDIGHWNIGYKEFRTWYDGSGGFFPQNGQWFLIYEDQLALDRGEAWFEGELTLPDLPILGFHYTHEFRNGRKDSLHWGDSRLTGGFGTRKIVPSFRDINEQRDIFDGYLKHTMDETTFLVGMKYELTADDNRLYVQRHPLENIDRKITTRETQSADLFSVYGSTETWFSDKTMFSTGYAWRTFDSNIGGSFIYGTDYDVPFIANFTNRQTNDSGFIDLDGGSQLEQEVVSLNTMVIPMQDLTLISGIRVEHEDADGSASHIQTSVAAGGVASQAPRLGTNDSDFLNVSQILEARYKGITGWLFYARGGWDEGNSEISESLINPDTGAITFKRDTTWERFNQKYTLGANWYPLTRLNFGSQYYHKIHKRSYVHRNDSTNNESGGDRYPGYINAQDWTMDDVNLRMTWRLLNNLTSVSRYDYQQSTIDSQMGSLAAEESGRTTSHIFGESITWNPISQLYLQGNINYAMNRTETPISGFTGMVLESKNNYLSTSFVTGYALNQKTDLQAQYIYYLADNYYDNSDAGLPLGSGAEEHGVTLSATHRVTENISWTTKYGFFTYTDKLYGGFNDYDAHLIYTSLQMKF